MNFFNLTFDELTSICINFGAKPFTSRQIYDWIYKKQVIDFSKMTNLPKKVIPELQKKLQIEELKIIKKSIDSKDQTIKFLYQLTDGNLIETVIMKFDWGYSICISTEIGCTMNCKFCASGQLKLKRRLTAGEIVEQFYWSNKFLKETKNSSISNIVIMGIGEPFDNYEELSKAIKIINHKNGINLGIRHITVSTCGILDKIIKFAYDFPQVNLAISLHAPNNKIRNQLMPINKIYPIDNLLKTLDEYIKITNNRISFEYILIKDLNDSDECLDQLVKIAKARLCYINLIEFNEVLGSKFKKSEQLSHFKNVLYQNNIITTIRLKRGSNINAACGQLRAQYEKK